MSGRGSFRNRGTGRGSSPLNAKIRKYQNTNSRVNPHLRTKSSIDHNISPRGRGQIGRRLTRLPAGRSPRGTSRGGFARGGIHTQPPLITGKKAILSRLGAPTDARDRLIHTRRRSVNDARSQIRRTQLSKTGDLRAVLKSTEISEDPELARELARVHTERTYTRENSDDVLLSFGSSLHHTDSVNAPRKSKGINSLVISRNFSDSNQPPPDDYQPEHPLDISPPPPLMSIDTDTWSRSPSNPRSLGYWDDEREQRPNITRTFDRSRSRTRSPRFNSDFRRRAHSAERRRSPNNRFEREHFNKQPRDPHLRDSRDFPPRDPHRRGSDHREPREHHSYAPMLKVDRHRYRDPSPEIRSTIHRTERADSRSRYDNREPRYNELSPRYSSPPPPIRPSHRRSYSRSPLRDREFRQVPVHWNGPSPSHLPPRSPYRRSASPRRRRSPPPIYHREQHPPPQYRRPVNESFKDKPEAVRRERYDESRQSPPKTNDTNSSQSSDKYRRSNSKQQNPGFLNSRPNAPAHPPGASANGSRLPNKIYYRVRISNLGDKVHQGDVEDLFGEMGKIKSIVMKTVGTAEVTYYDHNSVERSIEEYHRRELDKRPMEVVYMGEVSI